MKPLSQWTYRTWGLVVAVIAAIGVLTDGLAGFRVLAEYQPFATKSWVAAQQAEISEQVLDLRWDQLSTRALLLERQVADDEFKTIQLQALIEADPTDSFKKDALGDLKRAIADNAKELNYLRCQLASRSDGRTCVPP